MTKRTPTFMTLLAGLGAAVGCSDGSEVNIGNTQSLGGKLSDYAATWDGYAEAYTFPPSNSDHLHLVIAADGTGSMQVGSDPLLPTATDPDVGYPPNVVLDPNSLIGDLMPGLAGGVLYPLHAAQVQTNRIQIGLKPHDYYAGWCALQSSYRVFLGWTDSGTVLNYGYRCLPGASGSESIDLNPPQCNIQINAPDGSYSQQPADCGKYTLCLGRVCDCDATSCGSSPTMPADATPPQYPAELDAALDSSGTSMTGTLNLDGMRITVHLQRQ